MSAPNTIKIPLPDPPGNPPAEPGIKVGPMLAPAEDARRALALTWDGKDLSILLGIDITTVRAWDAEGRMPAPIRVSGCRRVLWNADEIRDWLASAGPDGTLPDRLTWSRMRKARKAEGRVGR